MLDQKPLRHRSCRFAVVLGVTLSALFLVLPAVALAHLERPSYWPDPAPDHSVSPPAGGEVPDARSLRSAPSGAGPGQVLVVCKGRDGKQSLADLRASVSEARKKGYRLRPSQPKIKLSKKEADRLLRINAALARQCDYDSVQKAILDAGNNDRVVILPGRYTEPDSRSAPENDPKCNPSLLQEDAGGDLTPSYEYQVTCPNDQNLIYIQGREVVGDPPEPPLSNRRASLLRSLVPACAATCSSRAREPSRRTSSSMPAPTTRGRGRRRSPAGTPRTWSCASIVRTVSSDATSLSAGGGAHVLQRRGRRHPGRSREVLLGRGLRAPSFTSDHNLVENCEGLGAGDSVVYPGAAPETGSQATSFYPDAPRVNTVITKCDLHGSALGYSGSMGNAVHITNNHIYGNSTGISSDTLSAAVHRHPGRQLPDRPQLHLREQPRPVYRRPARRAAPWECRSGPGSSTPA